MPTVQNVDLHFSNSILQTMNNGIIIVDCEGIISFCNEAVCKMLNKKRDKIIGIPLSAIIPNVTSGQASFKPNIKSSYELKIGNQVFILNQSPTFEHEQLVGAVIVFQNITSIKSYENSLENKIDQYEDALNILSECILGVDEQGIVNFITDSYAQFIGKDPQHVIGKHCTEVVENTRMHIVVQTGQAEIGHIQHLSDRNIIAIRIPIVKEGKIVGAIGKIMFQDIQQLKVLAQQINVMESKLDYYQKELKRLQGVKFSLQNIIGNSEKLKEVKEMALKVARSRSTVLIRGESGTGKELFAHAIHNASPRSEGPFIRLNCAAIPRDLLEAELFGYEEGAFTGAKKGGKPGKIELAKDGTLFLDEIGDMPLDMQAKLLRVLQEKEIERIGGTKISQIDVRFIAATHQNIWEMVGQGKFREDLFYRLNVFTIDIPPLRERKEDIMPTTQFLIKKLNDELGTNISTIDEEVDIIFREYDWPGNIRELENVLERSMNVVEENIIRVQHLPVYLSKKVLSKGSVLKNYVPQENYLLQLEVELAERRAIVKALARSSGNRQLAAKLLGIHRASLYRKMEKYQIEDIEMKGV